MRVSNANAAWARVLTNKRGVKKFENTLTDAGVNTFDIRYELTGRAKADFIKSAKIAFHPASLESYGFSAMETLAAGLPTLLIEEYEWWKAFEGQGVFVCARRDSSCKLQSIYHSENAVNSITWRAAESETKSKWAALS